jgi:ribosomal protein S18 acetylase RimI-like enzyme
VRSPESLDLRRATARDSMGVARVHIETWRSAYRGIVPQAFLDTMSVQRRARNYTFDASGPNDPLTWIALDSGTVVGFVTIAYPMKDDSVGTGEVAALYVASDRWRSGIGSLLLNKAESLLMESGATSARLWVLEKNERGRRFYEAEGWRHDGGEQTIEIGGEAIVEVRYQKTLAAQA